MAQAGIKRGEIIAPPGRFRSRCAIVHPSKPADTRGAGQAGDLHCHAAGPQYRIPFTFRVNGCDPLQTVRKVENDGEAILLKFSGLYIL